jgi:quercetin dioxygenase-like cupin family protein
MEMTILSFNEDELMRLEAIFMHKDKEEVLRFLLEGIKPKLRSKGSPAPDLKKRTGMPRRSPESPFINDFQRKEENPMEEKTINFEKMEWRKTPGYPLGRKIKVLREEQPGGGRTFLLKLEKGFDMEGHSHNSLEQHFVIEGEYESEGKIYKAGTYRLIPKHETHGPFTSSKGAVILVIWDPEHKDLPADLEEMKKTVQNLPKEEKIKFLQEVVPVVCKDLSGDEQCIDMLKEAFGETFVKEMMKRSEEMIII